MEGPLLGFDCLPEVCVSTILSLTSPQDACKCSLVSTTFQSAAESDFVWERFLPSDYHDIVSRSITPLKFSSKKELFRLLCDPIFIDGGKKSFKLEKFSGKKSYILSARDLFIAWSNEPMYWSWNSLPEPRFLEVAILRTTCWLEIQGKIRTRILSQNTTYGAYLILKTLDRSYGLDSKPCEISVEVGNQASTSTAYLRCSDQDSKNQQMDANGAEMLNSSVVKVDKRLPIERRDGWMEIELGEFYSGDKGDDKEVKMSLMEVKGHHLKGGLIIKGIEVRSKN